MFCCPPRFGLPASDQESSLSIDNTGRIARARRLGAVACLVLVVCVLTSGCDQSGSSKLPSGPKPPLGGGTPLTSKKLSGVTLEAIREPLRWRFGASTVGIDFDDKPIPGDLVETLTGSVSPAEKIEASWRYDELSGELHLSEIQVDGRSMPEDPLAREVVMPIRSAGKIRVDLGIRQYNMSYDRSPDP